MDFTVKLGSFADRSTFQGTELSWRSGRCSGHHLDCPGSRRAVYLHFCAGSDCVVHLAGDRHAAQQSGQDSDERAFERGIDLHQGRGRVLRPSLSQSNHKQT